MKYPYINQSFRVIIFGIILGSVLLSSCASKDSGILITNTSEQCAIDCEQGDDIPTDSDTTLLPWNNGRGDLAGTSVSDRAVLSSLSTVTTYTQTTFAARQTAVVDSAGNLYVCADDQQLKIVAAANLELSDTGANCKGDLTVVNNELIYVDADTLKLKNLATGAELIIVDQDGNAVSTEIGGAWPKLMSHEDELYYSHKTQIVRLIKNESGSYEKDAVLDFSTIDFIGTNPTIVDAFVVQGDVVVAVTRRNVSGSNAGVQSLVAGVFEAGVFDQKGIALIEHQTSELRTDDGGTISRGSNNSTQRVYQQITEPVIVDGVLYVSKYYLLSELSDTTRAGKFVKVDAFVENSYATSESGTDSKETQLYQINISDIVTAAESHETVALSGANIDGYRYSPVSGIAGRSMTDLVLGVRTANQEYPFLSTYVQDIVNDTQNGIKRSQISSENSQTCYNFQDLYSRAEISSRLGAVLEWGSRQDTLNLSDNYVVDSNGNHMQYRLGSVSYPMLDRAGRSVFVFSSASFAQTGTPYNQVDQSEEYLLNEGKDCDEYFAAGVNMDAVYSGYSNVMLKYADNQVIELRSYNDNQVSVNLDASTQHAEWLNSRSYIIGSGQVVVINADALVIVK